MVVIEATIRPLIFFLYNKDLVRRFQLFDSLPPSLLFPAIMNQFMPLSRTIICFFFLALLTISHSVNPSNFLAMSSTNDAPVKHTLLPPLIIHDGRLVACSRKNLFAFERNGSLAWVVPLGLFCKEDTAPVTDDRGKIYLVAENSVLKINPSKIGSIEPPSKVLYTHNSSEEILGLSVSPSYLSLFITIRHRGLFSFLLRGELQWNIGPTLNRFGYTLGCTNDPLNCYFNSAPVVDLCEGTLYVSNTEGQLYSVYIRNPQFRWIQELGDFGDKMVITPGNNGFVYATFPKQAVIVCLDASTGNITWQQTVGPLSGEIISPIVDSNGCISIGSLDGTLYSISPDGNLKKLLEETASDSVIQASPALDCSGFAVYISQTRLDSKITHNTGASSYVSALGPVQVQFTLLAPATGTVYWASQYPGQRTTWTCSQAEPMYARTNSGEEDANLQFLLVQTIILVTLFLVVRFCCVFWRKEKLKDNGLSGFLEKRRSLHSQKKELSKLISELEQMAMEEATGNETLEDLGQIVKQKEGVERKLHNSYSLGRDHTVGSAAVLSILPLYNGKMKSHSFHNLRRKENITIFNTFSDSSSVDKRGDSETGYSGSSSSSWETENPEVEVQEVEDGIGIGEIVEASRVYSNPIYNEIEMDLAGEERNSGLKRRSHSSTY